MPLYVLYLVPNTYTQNGKTAIGKLSQKLRQNCREVNQVQYSIGDFDFLCIQLPETAEHCCCVIPQECSHTDKLYPEDRPVWCIKLLLLE